MQLDFLKKAKKNEIMALTVAICGVVIAVYYFLFLAPIASKLPSLFRETARVQDKINKAELAIKSMPKIKKEIKELESREDFYNSKLPSEEEFPAVLKSLSTMAKDTGVKITKILPVKEAAVSADDNAYSGIYRQEVIAIDAQCGYHQLGAFISQLENAERFMELVDIKIEAGGVSPKRHNVQLIVNTFILKSEDK